MITEILIVAYIIIGCAMFVVVCSHPNINCKKRPIASRIAVFLVTLIFWPIILLMRFFVLVFS